MAEQFAWLGPEEHFNLPRPERGTSDGIVGAGGSLSLGMLLSVHRQGACFRGIRPEIPFSGGNPTYGSHCCHKSFECRDCRHDCWQDC